MPETAHPIRPAYACHWLTPQGRGSLAARVRAADAIAAAQAAVRIIAADYGMGRPPVLASSLHDRSIGLHNPVKGERIVTVEVAA